jgi:hypothetical protein
MSICLRRKYKETQAGRMVSVDTVNRSATFFLRQVRSSLDGGWNPRPAATHPCVLTIGPLARPQQECHLLKQVEKMHANRI